MTEVEEPGPALMVDLPDVAATGRLAGRLAGVLRPGDVLALSGDLGSGKTTLARALIAAVAERQGVDPPTEVPSPTYTLVQIYPLGELTVWHFDLYRIRAAEEMIELGFEDALETGLSVIEWPERLGDAVPADRIEIVLELAAGEEGRRAALSAYGACRGRLAEVAWP